MTDERFFFNIKSTDRPIKIEIVVESSDKSGLIQRLAPKPAEAVTTVKPKTKKAIKKPTKKRSDQPKQEKRVAKSAEDLDAEMEVSLF
ncbi:hypothetical protein J056_004656 [Wallemia ichthyophaga EXF-994]|uniref:Uncharacterized protein n=1 Tax=Wallemia ichthyophaga (strain EXF-994 / CBS 113033) TaxID=1299270 RepID=R9AF48_WALI9|nr:uncharacterized protein J056_004656 [Wallemia ichthyophaga EXF-994]EOR00844.1 hypothetical protein J056_004656 [Wallemia ichthyophaga EXF-994]